MRPSHRLRITAPLMASALLLAACAADEPDEDTAAGEEPAEEEPAEEEPAEEPDTEPDPEDPEDADAPDGVALEVTEGDLGTFLVDGEGMVLYLFTSDTDGESTCYDDCAEAWPPLLSDDTPELGGEIDEDLVGSTTRDDGSEQVTYADWPLYHFAADEEPGETSGQGVNDVWYVLGPDGEMIDDEPDDADADEDDDSGSSSGGAGY